MNNSNKKICFELHSILIDVVKNFWIVVLAILISVMSIFIAERSFFSPEYTSSATIAVMGKMNNNVSYTSLKVSAEMADVYSEIFVQQTIKDKAAEYIGAEKFDGELSASVLQNTNLLKISVTSDNPMNSYNLLNAIMEVYPSVSDSVFSNAVLTVMKNPSIPVSPSNNISFTIKCLCVLLSAFVTLALIVALSILRDTVKNEESFRNNVDSTLFAMIVHENKRVKLSKIITDIKGKNKVPLLIGESSYRSLKFTESYYKMAAKIKYLNSKNGDRVFAVTSVGENEGKSTISSNIAIALADSGNRVLLLDFDARKPAVYKIFEKETDVNSNLSSIFTKKVELKDFIFKSYKDTSLHFGLNTGCKNEYQNWLEKSDVKGFFNELLTFFDYIIVDTAPISVDSTLTNLVRYVDETIMVVRTNTSFTSHINDAILTIKEVGGNFAGCILNDVYPEILFLNYDSANGSYYHSKKYSHYGKYSYGRYSRYSRPISNDAVPNATPYNKKEY